MPEIEEELQGISFSSIQVVSAIQHLELEKICGVAVPCWDDLSIFWKMKLNTEIPNRIPQK